MTAYPRESSGELAAFERIMAQCERRVLRVALRLLNNRQDAQDATQEVFLRLYKHLGDLDETGGYEPWLYRVTVNVCHDMARARRRSIGLAEVPDPVAPQPDAYHDAARSQQREIVRRGLSFLGEKERAALVLRDVEGLSTREVAGILGSSENTVRSQISTARLKLRDFAGPHHEEAMMSCSKFETDIALYAGGDLPAGRIPRVESHLAECPDCRALAEELRASRLPLSELRDEPLEDAMVAQVRRRVMAELGGADFSLRGTLVPLLALAAALLLTVVLLWPRHAAINIPAARVEPPRLTPVAPPSPTNIIPVRHRIVRHHRRTPAAQSGTPLLVQFVTDNPNIVIYWLVDPETQGD